MTSQNDVREDAAYTLCLDHGFVGLIDHMGSDEDIARAARLSYGKGTKSVSEDRNLIRYLVRHKHTSPIEMAEVKLHLKLPIFIMRQLVRHRTASLNEYSGRYSIMSDEFYVPDLDQIKPQSTSNKQGRDGELTDAQRVEVQKEIRHHQEGAYQCYQLLIEGYGDADDLMYDEPLSQQQGFTGVARELARTVLPVSNYTELYWKQDLHNLLHLIKLRRDPHAQYEIRVFAEAIYQAIKPLFPLTCEAWEDYVWEAVTLSRMEVEAMKILIGAYEIPSDEAFTKLGMSKRELAEFKVQWEL